MLDLLVARQLVAQARRPAENPWFGARGPTPSEGGR